MNLRPGLNLLVQQSLNLSGGTPQIGVVDFPSLGWDQYFSIGIILYAESSTPLSVTNPNAVLDLGPVAYKTNLFRIPVLFSGNLFRGLFIDALDSGVGLRATGNLFRNP